MNTSSPNLFPGLTCHSAEAASVVQRHTVIDSAGLRLTISSTVWHHDCFFQYDDRGCVARAGHETSPSTSLVFYARLHHHHQSASLDLLMYRKSGN